MDQVQDLPSRSTDNHPVYSFESVGSDDRILWLQAFSSMHLLQYLRREGLSTILYQPLVFLASNGVEGDVQHIWPDFCSGGFDSLDDFFGEGFDVAVGRVEDDSDDWFGPVIRVRSESALGKGTYIMMEVIVDETECESE